MNKLRELRKKTGTKQCKLAGIIGTSLSNYSKKEKGEIKISLIEAKILADFFEIPIEKIFFAEVAESEICSTENKAN